MKITRTKFEGLLLLEPAIFRDKRGKFFETFREKEYKEAGIKEPFVQDNVSVSQKNVLRGLHIRKDQGQMLTVLSGKIFDVVVDLRPGSPTYKKHFSVEISSDHPQQIYMPPGFAHGFCVLSDEATLHYKCTQYYNSEKEKGVLWSDSDLNINWPVKNPIVSERDQRFSNLEK